MVRVWPIGGYLISPEHAAAVSPPAHDALTPEERIALADANQLSYLNVIRSAADYPIDTRPPPSEVRAGNAARLKAMIDQGVFLPADGRHFYVYGLEWDGGRQLGVVADLPVGDVATVVKPHERVTPDRAAEMAEYLAEVHASSSPICLAYRSNPSIDAIVEGVGQTDPLLRFESPGDVTQSVWRLDPRLGEELAGCFADQVSSLYLIDGHHRTAATAMHAASHPGEHCLLAVMFPSHHLGLVAFDRYVAVEPGTTPELLGRLREEFLVEDISGRPAERPSKREEILMCLEGDWFLLVDLRPPPKDVLASLSVSVLHRRILGPLFGAGDSDVTYLPATSDLEAVEARCRRTGEVAFAVVPPTIDEVMAVSELGGLMPPKSTYFLPKVRTGVFVVDR
jgi:uncharacterized protein (DUF1015 family)